MADPLHRVETVDPIADPRWRQLVECHAEATIFHHPAWMRLLRDQYGYAVSALGVAAPGGALVAGLPIATVTSRLTGARLVSLPFSDACAGLETGDAGTDVLLSEAIAAAVDTAGLGLEIRGDAAGVPRSQTVRRFWVHRLLLSPDPQVVLRGCRPSIRRGVAKAQRAGLVGEWRTDPEGLRVFFDLHLQTRRRQGVPTQPKRFVLRFSELFREGLGSVLVVRHGAAAIAAGVFLMCNRTLTYKYGASDARHLGLRPNNLLFMEAIRWGCEHGCAVLDLGRTDLHNDGLRSFKRAWGSEESDLMYTYIGRSPPGLQPKPAERLLATAIRRGPRALGRVVGAALYKHVG